MLLGGGRLRGEREAVETWTRHSFQLPSSSVALHKLEAAPLPQLQVSTNASYSLDLKLLWESLEVQVGKARSLPHKCVPITLQVSINFSLIVGPQSLIVSPVHFPFMGVYNLWYGDTLYQVKRSGDLLHISGLVAGVTVLKERDLRDGKLHLISGRH
ncbi:hypothetical protein Y1Q_0001920 [Alligator mississippiensis]|uniref:Uncharacterized protein n=1 Tax=Alligator mississippiensis TaxID=8496 RepID=A0A151PGF3_ALLMI|nr:hypothetical protein Y1Q_0001920 [Alligator mississippiensis]